ncbi:hypothetical protein [Flavobacterium flavigenum]|uniref:hypothetical protein n=1 Tax=Flavobacterium flavigenum TaxID=3003258 RepID=UPI002482CF2E|nr:hypothetical protein [Flavobacterium flavigenum]
MKKKLCLFGALILLLASCTNDSSEENSLLPKKQIYTYGSQTGENTTTTYSYTGNKIDSLNYDDGTKIVFTYTGDLITKAIYTEDGEDNSTTTTFAYENNKLKSFLEVSPNSSSRKKTYTYNTDGTISTITVLINPITQQEIQDSSSILTLDANGNIIKAEFNDFVNTVEYDNKNNPFKSITGYTFLLDSGIFDQEANSVNNISKITENTGGVVNGTFTYKNTYNSDNYLIKSVQGDETYEYIY